MNDSPTASTTRDAVSTLDGTGLVMFNSRVITDCAHSRHLSPGKGVTTPKELATTYKYADTFGYTVHEWETADRQGYPLSVIQFVKVEKTEAAKADERTILDSSLAWPDRRDALARLDARFSGDLIEEPNWRIAHCYVIEYYTRVPCATHSGHYASNYASVTDEDGVTTIPQPYCGWCMTLLRQSADDAGHTVNESVSLRIGQHG